MQKRAMPPQPIEPRETEDGPDDNRRHRFDGVRSAWLRLPGNLRGAIWMLLATAVFSVMLVLIKFAGQRLHVSEILFVRQVTMVTLAAPVIIRGFPGSLISQRVDLQLLRVVTAFFAMLLGFTAVIHLPLANATTISFAKTFFVTILAIVLLGEVVGIRRWAALAVGFAGVVIVAWPDSGEGFSIYAAMALVSAACVGLVMILIR